MSLISFFGNRGSGILSSVWHLKFSDIEFGNFSMFIRTFFSIFLGTLVYGYTDSEALCLRNIRQITFCSMGFEKAGEAYFSPDGQSIIFQAVPLGRKGYQIYKMDLNSQIPIRISTGKGKCTCGFFRPDGKRIIFASSHEAPEETEIPKSLDWATLSEESKVLLQKPAAKWEMTTLALPLISSP